MTSPTILRRVFVARMLRTATIAGAVMALAVPAMANDDKGKHQASQRDSTAVVQWNTIAGEAFTPSQGTNPMAQSRTLAILHASVHDALNAIEPRYQSYTPGLPAAPKASADAAVAAAAREVLITLLPQRTALVESAYDRALLQIRDGAARAAGIATGQAAARATMNRRLATVLPAPRSRPTCHAPAPASTSSPRRSTSRCSPVGAGCSPLSSSCVTDRHIGAS